LIFSTGRDNTSRDRSGMSLCDRGLSTRGRVLSRGHDNSRKCTHCNRTNHTN